MDMNREMLEESLSQDIEKGFGEGLFPIQIIHTNITKYPEFTKQEIIVEVANYIECFRLSRDCNRNGHKTKYFGADINPDSGSEYFVCTRCGTDLSVTYY